MGRHENEAAEATFARAVGEFRAGRLAEAARLIDRVLQGDAEHPMALNLLATITLRRSCSILVGSTRRLASSSLKNNRLYVS